PYLTFMVSPDGEAPNARQVAAWSPSQLFDHLEKKVLPQAIDWMRDSREAALRHGLRLVAYEGGQHLIGVQGAENDESLNRLFLEANAHPRMGELYRRYLAAWAQTGGDLFCHYS